MDSQTASPPAQGSPLETPADEGLPSPTALRPPAFGGERVTTPADLLQPACHLMAQEDRADTGKPTPLSCLHLLPSCILYILPTA